jgi:hypothetical protein
MGVDAVPIVLTATIVEVNIGDLDETFALPEIATCPHEQHKREGEEGLEEALSISDTAARGNDGRDKLGDQSNDAECEANPRPPDTENVLERDFIESVSMMGPRGSESNVALGIVSFPSSVGFVYHLPRR